jgi:hypothetical protein
MVNIRSLNDHGMPIFEPPWRSLLQTVVTGENLSHAGLSLHQPSCKFRIYGELFQAQKACGAAVSNHQSAFKFPTNLLIEAPTSCSWKNTFKFQNDIYIIFRSILGGAYKVEANSRKMFFS